MMDGRGKINAFCKILGKMINEVSGQELSLKAETSKSMLESLVSTYGSALELIVNDPSNKVTVDKLFSAPDEQALQNIFANATETEINNMGAFGEKLLKEGKPSEAAKLFQFLTLFCPEGKPNPYAYTMLAEALSDLSLDSGMQMYDFILNIFPDNPLVLISAAKCYYDGERPKRALNILNHAKDICEKHKGDFPQFKTFLAQIEPEIEKISAELQ